MCLPLLLEVLEMVRKSKEEADKTYHALLDAALDLFKERGVAQTALNDIARAVAMTRGAVYWHFENKDDMVIALWQRDGQTVLDRLVADLKRPHLDDPLRAFQESVRSVVALLSQNPRRADVIRLTLSCQEFAERDTELQQLLRRIMAELYDGIVCAMERLRNQGRLQAGLPVPLAAYAVWSSVLGMAQWRLPQNDAITLGDAAPVVVEMFLGAVLRQPDGG